MKCLIRFSFCIVFAFEMPSTDFQPGMAAAVALNHCFLFVQALRQGGPAILASPGAGPGFGGLAAGPIKPRSKAPYLQNGCQDSWLYAHEVYEVILVSCSLANLPLSVLAATIHSRGGKKWMLALYARFARRYSVRNW